MKNKKTHWITIGYAGVDSGLLMIADPCYVLKDEKSKMQPITVNEVIQRFNSIEQGGIPYLHTILSGVGGDGVVFHTPHGDGSYPIEAKVENFEANGKTYQRILEVRIKF